MVTLILLNLISVWFFGNVFLYLVYNHEIVHYIYYKVFSWIGGSNANFGGSGQGAYNPGGGQAPGPGPGGGENEFFLEQMVEDTAIFLQILKIHHIHIFLMLVILHYILVVGIQKKKKKLNLLNSFIIPV